MDLIDKLKELSQKVEKQRFQIQNEEATKTAFILPFIQAWGYDVFDPSEVCPEYTADAVGLKAEKVDYAICLGEKPIILIECKSCAESLDNTKHISQLSRYFSVTDVTIGVLTNGIVYKFFTDINKDNLMDDKPFLEFNILNFEEEVVNEIKQFSKSSFTKTGIKEKATTLLYTKETKKLISEQLADPSPDFVKFFLTRIYSGKQTSKALERFTEITKQSLKEFINEEIRERIKQVIPSQSEKVELEKEIVLSDTLEVASTISEEQESYYIIKSILRQEIDTTRIQWKPTKRYIGINLDGKVNKTICRLRFNERTNKRAISIPDNLEPSKEAILDLDDLDSLYSVAESIKSRTRYLTQDAYTKNTESLEVL